MPTRPRRHQLRNSLIYHAYNRSNNRVPIFIKDEDYQHFLTLLREYCARFILRMYHWVIMSNHFHILFEIKNPEEISPFMAGLERAYTHYHHSRYHESGLLWQGRFKLQPVQKERYLIACGRYIERNPVRARITQAAADYHWSSASYYCTGVNDNLTYADPTYVNFGPDAGLRQSSYRQFLQNFDTEKEKMFRSCVNPVGNRSFIGKLQLSRGRYVGRRKGGYYRGIRSITC